MRYQPNAYVQGTGDRSGSAVRQLKRMQNCRKRGRERAAEAVDLDKVKLQHVGKKL
jgi:hypothetical protein